ncbi:hypothetical protein EKK58_09215 [Candidatus Dependentiae bacterium]|nr:MAG: hypothetical protein EKK58_09215 [Candidatus Dependentiae bacterium]
MTDLNTALDAFNTVANNAQAAYWERMKFTYAPPPKVTYTIGKKFAKYVTNDSSVFAFVDLSNGDILKPATWAKPAKHARGNIYSPSNGAEALNGCHIKYLK